MKFQLTKAENPKVGDIRYKYPFAIIPTLCEDGWMVWLERYLITEEYNHQMHFGTRLRIPNGNFEWKLVSKRAIKDGENGLP